jgi:hypothetical protein
MKGVVMASRRVYQAALSLVGAYSSAIPQQRASLPRAPIADESAPTEARRSALLHVIFFAPPTSSNS